MRSEPKVDKIDRLIWLYNLGLEVELYSSFNYKEFGDRGEKYLEEEWGKERFEKEKRNGAFKNISYIQKATQEIVRIGLWINKKLTVEKLSKEVENKDTLAIGKTVHEWLEGNYINGTSHYILVIKENSPEMWKVHDPGLPGIKYRKIQQKINNHSMLEDILLVRGKRK